MPAGPSGTSPVAHDIRVEAAPETVFAYFTDPARMVRWMGTEATLDPRPGGVCRLSFLRDLGQIVMSGKFVEVDPPRRLVFTWGWEGDAFGTPPESTRVEVDLVPDGDGTIVRLVHSQVSDEGVRIHSAGWPYYLARLSVSAAGGEPGPDDWIPPGVPIDPTPPRGVA